jgi:hypothetical protein
MADPERRRRRLRHSPTGSGPVPEAGTGPTETGSGPTDAGTHRVTTRTARSPRSERDQRTALRPHGGTEEQDGERGLRGLVGAGSSQVRPAAALRIRDAARPTAADLAEAEANLVIIRRHWVPREGLPQQGR